MNEGRLYEILRPETAERRARWCRTVHDAMVAAGIAAMLADTVGPMASRLSKRDLQ